MCELVPIKSPIPCCAGKPHGVILMVFTFLITTKNITSMYYVVNIKEYRVFKPDLQLIETVDDIAKAVALRDALQAVHPDHNYQVMEVK